VTEKEQHIIAGAGEVFMKCGIKSVNMDDIAKNLGVSKKTLYKYVQDKNDLLRKSLAMHADMEDMAIGLICEKDQNAIDELLDIAQWITSVLQKIHPSIHFDLEKYHPEVWKEMIDNRHKMVYTCMKDNMEKGIKEGLYREDLNIDVIAKIYMAKIDVTFDATIFPPQEISFSEVYREYFRYHIRGIASEKGITYLKKKVKEMLK
jgi:AcrR family transcriptional regulator